jgi:hypothetical protein
MLRMPRSSKIRLVTIACALTVGAVWATAGLAAALPQATACSCTTCDGANACRYKLGNKCFLNGTSCATFACGGGLGCQDPE